MAVPLIKLPAAPFAPSKGAGVAAPVYGPPEPGPVSHPFVPKAVPKVSVKTPVAPPAPQVPQLNAIGSTETPQQGTYDPSVAKIQEQMNAQAQQYHVAPIKVDGIMGPETKALGMAIFKAALNGPNDLSGITSALTSNPVTSIQNIGNEIVGSKPAAAVESAGRYVLPPNTLKPGDWQGALWDLTYMSPLAMIRGLKGGVAGARALKVALAAGEKPTTNIARDIAQAAAKGSHVSGVVPQLGAVTAQQVATSLITVPGALKQATTDPQAYISNLLHSYEHPSLMTPFDIAAALSLGHGSWLRLAAARDAEGILSKVKAFSGPQAVGKRALTLPSGEKSPLIPSINPSFRGVQKAYDAFLQHSINVKPEGPVAQHAFSRVGGALQSGRRVAEDHAQVVANLATKATAKLKPWEHTVIDLTSTNVPVETRIAEVQGYLAKTPPFIEHGGQVEPNPAHARLAGQLNELQHIQQAGVTKVAQGPDGAPHVVVNHEVAPQLAKVDGIVATAQDLKNKLSLQEGMSPAGAQARIDAPGRIARGGKFMDYPDFVQERLAANETRSMLHTVAGQQLGPEKAGDFIQAFDRLSLNHAVNIGDHFNPDALYQGIKALHGIETGGTIPPEALLQIDRMLTKGELPVHLTHDEAMTMAQKVLDSGHKLPPGMRSPEAVAKALMTMHAQAIEGWEYKDWYPQAAAALQDFAKRLDVPVQTVVELASVYSMSMAPSGSLDFVLKAIQTYRKTGKVAVWSRIGESQRVKVQEILKYWNPKTGVLKDHPLRGWDEYEHETTGTTAQKTPNFTHNIAVHIPELAHKADLNAVTIDRHEGRIIGDQYAKGIQNNYYGAARAMGQLVAEHQGITPAESQAARWAIQKARTLMLPVGEGGSVQHQAVTTMEQALKKVAEEDYPAKIKQMVASGDLPSTAEDAGKLHQMTQDLVSSGHFADRAAAALEAAKTKNPNEEGYSLNADGTPAQTKRYIVSEPGEVAVPAGEDATSAIAAHHAANIEHVRATPGAVFGAWRGEDGRLALDISHSTDDLEHAKQIGIANKQDGIFDTKTGETIPLPKEPTGAALRASFERSEPWFAQRSGPHNPESAIPTGGLDTAGPFGVKGAIQFTEPGAHAFLTEASDFSTYTHEFLGHYALEDFAHNPGDLIGIIRAAGIKPEKGAEFNTEGQRVRATRETANAKKVLADLTPDERTHVHEFIARQMEAYFRDGARNLDPAMNRIMSKAKTYMAEIYGEGELPDLNPRIARIFDRMYGKPEPGHLPEKVLVGGESDFVGRGYLPQHTQESVRGAGGPTRAAGKVIGRTPPPLQREQYTGEGRYTGNMPAEPAKLLAESLQRSVKWANRRDARAEIAKLGTDELPAGANVDKYLLVNEQGFGHQVVPEWAKERVGLTRSTVAIPAHSEATIEALQGYQQWHDNLFVTKANVMHQHADVRAAFEHGTSVPGYKWVPKNLISKQLADLGAPGAGWRWVVMDAINTASKNLLVYLKPAHVATRVLANAGFNLIHGALSPTNLTYSSLWWNTSDELTRTLGMGLAGQGYAHSLEAADLASAERGPARVMQKGLHWGAAQYAKIDALSRWNALVLEARRAGFDTQAKFEDMLHSEDPAVVAERKQIGILANREAGDYSRMGPAEQRIVRRIFYFYPWMKTSTVWAGRSLIEHPAKSSLLLHTGLVGLGLQNQQFGPLSQTDQGMVPFGPRTTGPNGDIMQQTANFSGISPWATPGELGNAAVALAGGEPTVGASLIASWFGPVTSAVNQMVNHLNTYGQAAPVGQPWYDNLYQNFVGGSPLVNIAKQAIGGGGPPAAPTKYGKEFPDKSLEAQAERGVISSGVPRTTDISAAQYWGAAQAAANTGNTFSTDWVNLTQNAKKVNVTLPPVVQQELETRDAMTAFIGKNKTAGEKVVLAAQFLAQHGANAELRQIGATFLPEAQALKDNVLASISLYNTLFYKTAFPNYNTYNSLVRLLLKTKGVTP